MLVTLGRQADPDQGFPSQLSHGLALPLVVISRLTVRVPAVHRALGRWFVVLPLVRVRWLGRVRWWRRASGMLLRRPHPGRRAT
ncbi:MAG: hypothetical protein ACRDT8_08665 [Micromonosporaceae bacterium]